MNKYKYNLNFRLEKRKQKGTGELIKENLPILADITFVGKRIFYYTGYRIDQSKWQYKDEKTGEKVQRVKRNNFSVQGESSTEINAKINEVEAVVRKIFQRLEVEGIEPTTQQVRGELKKLLNDKYEDNTLQKYENIWNAFERYNRDSKISEGRRRHRKTAMNHFKRFESELGNTISFENSNRELISEFESFLVKDGDDPEKYKYLKPNKRPRKKSRNRIIGILKTIRAFYGWSKTEKLISLNPFDEYEIGSESYGRPIYLTKAERDHLYNAEIVNDRLNRVRDIFVFQCLIGCRVGDLVRLTEKNIIGGAIEYIPRKTKEGKPVVVRVPLSDKAKSILDKYNLPNGALLPFITDQRYNEYLKELFELVELNRIVTRLNPLTREEEKVPLYSIASSHMARRTFVGTLHRNVKDSVIANMSGHVENSRAFIRYYDVDEETRTDAINNFLD